MKRENAEKIVEWMQEQGYDAKIYEGYSRRGMYGKETTGICCDDPADVAEAMGTLKIKDSRRQDSLGKSCIVY